MNIYDLEKQATPGPLEDDGQTAAGQITWLCIPESQVTIGVHVDEHVARQIKHRYNHFMEALAALKRIRDMSALEIDMYGTGASNVIAKLEEVE